MKRVVMTWVRTGLTAALALSLYSPARADDPSGTLTVNGQTLDFSNLITLNAQTGMYVTPWTTTNVGGKKVGFEVTGDPDPVLSYAFSATNNNAGPTPFAFDVSIPIDPVFAGSALRSSLGITLTDGGNNGISVQPFPTSGSIQTATGDGNNLASTVTTISTGTGINLGSSTTGIPGGTSITLFKGTGTSPFGFSTLGIHLSFLLSGGGDNASFTGRIEVISVPEPGSIALLATSVLTGAGFLVRRRKNARRAT